MTARMTTAPITDDEVVEAISRRVAAGEYLDDIPGTPGARLDGGGMFHQTEGGQLGRMYRRGSPEHLDARSAGETERLPPLRVATPAAVAGGEAPDAPMWAYNQPRPR